MDIWDKYAKAYDRLTPLTSFYQDLQRRILKGLEGCEKVLDIGTGTGLLAEELAKKGKIVNGIDNNEAMLSFANARASGNSRLFFELQDAEHLNFEDCSFDGVSCINVLFYVTNPKQVLREAYRVTKKQGIFVVSGPKPNPDGKLLERIALEDYAKQPNFEELKADVQVIVECARQIMRNCLKNTYHSKDIADILADEIGFSSISLSDDSVYLNQGFLVIAQK
jgi:ubiquinone/menaquinone biosynthesis C-methylase UbiE